MEDSPCDGVGELTQDGLGVFGSKELPDEPPHLFVDSPVGVVDHGRDDLPDHIRRRQAGPGSRRLSLHHLVQLGGLGLLVAGLETSLQFSRA